MRSPHPDADLVLEPVEESARIPWREQLRVRYGVEPRVVVVLLLLGVLGIVLAVGVVWRGRVDVVGGGGAGADPRSPVVSTRSSASASSATASARASPEVPSPASPESPTAAVVVIDVAGLVTRPGVVRLPAGSRVVDAIAAAGGVLPGTDTSLTNLARVVVDGEQVVVGLPPGAGAGSSAPAPGSSSTPPGPDAVDPTTRPLDLNAASVEQLEGLPGVGPVLAGRIVAWREENGRFASVQELNEVSGIGEATYAELAPLVRV